MSVSTELETETEAIHLRVRLSDHSNHGEPQVMADVLRGLQNLALLSGYSDQPDRFLGDTAMKVYRQLSFEDQQVFIENDLQIQRESTPGRAIHALLSEFLDGYDPNQFRSSIRASLNSRPQLELVSITHESPYEVLLVVTSSIAAASATAAIVAKRIRNISRWYNEMRAEKARTDADIARSNTQTSAYMIIGTLIDRNLAVARQGGEVPPVEQVSIADTLAALEAIDKVRVELPSGEPIDEK